MAGDNLEKIAHDANVVGAVRAYLKAGRRLQETRADLKAAIAQAVADERLTPDEAAALLRDAHLEGE